ncbi:MAG TPA: lipopolysaccharide biosynthesis protein [Gemmatimonadales bacterium]
MKSDREGLTRRTLGGLLWMGSGKAAFTLLQLLVLSVLGRLVTPAEFGVVGAAIVVIGLSTIVSNLGLGPAIVQRPELEQRHLETAFTASLLLGLGLGALVWLGAPLAADFMRMPAVTPVLRALSWVFPINALNTVAGSLLARDLEFSWLAIRDVITYGLGYGVVGIGTALLGWGVWALVAGQIAQTALKSAVLLARHPPPRRLVMERQAFKDLAYFGGGFTVARLANYAAVYGDNVVTGRFLGPAALGYYGRAYSLMSAPAYAFGTVLDAVLFPAMAKVQDDPRRLAAAYLRAVALIALLVLPLSAVLILLAPEVIRVALGPKWTLAVVPFQVLGIGMLFRTSYKMSDSIARSTGAVYRRAWRQIIYAVLVVIGAWIGQRWGIVGVAWGALGALTVNFVIMAALSLDVARIGWNDFWRAHLPAVLLTLASFPPVWLVARSARALHLPALGVLVLAGGTLVLACGALVWGAPSRFLGRDGQWMVRTMRDFIGGSARRPRARRPIPQEAP